MSVMTHPKALQDSEAGPQSEFERPRYLPKVRFRSPKTDHPKRRAGAFVFGENWWPMVEIESSNLGVLFSGAKCRMRRVVVV